MGGWPTGATAKERECLLDFMRTRAIPPHGGLSMSKYLTLLKEHRRLGDATACTPAQAQENGSRL